MVGRFHGGDYNALHTSLSEEALGSKVNGGADAADVIGARTPSSEGAALAGSIHASPITQPGGVPCPRSFRVCGEALAGPVATELAEANATYDRGAALRIRLPLAVGRR
jgi:hypothetical protein